LINYRLFILTVFILLSGKISAQRFETGGIGYVTSYMGDLNPSDVFYYKDYGLGIYTKYNLNDTWGIRLGINQLRLAANDKDFNNGRNLSFQNNITELSLLSEFHFFNFKTEGKTSKFTPYVIGGLGIIKHDPYLYYKEKKFYLRTLKLEQDKSGENIHYSIFAFIIPLGLGFKYHIKGPWILGAECNYRIAFTNSIDNVSGYYSEEIPVAQNLPRVNVKNDDGSISTFNKNDWEFLTDPSNEYPKNIRTLRGNGKSWDGYLTTGLTLAYTWKSTACKW